MVEGGCFGECVALAVLEVCGSLMRLKKFECGGRGKVCVAQPRENRAEWSERGLGTEIWGTRTMLNVRNSLVSLMLYIYHYVIHN